MSKKSIVFGEKEVKTVQYHDLHKYNQAKPPVGTCAYCLEKATFRVVKINRVNQLCCTRCLRSARLYKTEPLKANRMFKKGKITFEDKVRRYIYMVVGYFTSNLVYYPFKIKRRSKLGVRITNTIIKVKGLKDA